MHCIARLSFIGPSHYAVHFSNDDCVVCVPKKVILIPPEPTVGDAGRVQWSDGMEYAATVLAMVKCLLESACSFLDVCICSQHDPRQALSCFNALVHNAAAARKAFSKPRERKSGRSSP